MNIRFGQKGIRRNQEDINLPDFICANRTKGTITGYSINKFYTNLDLSEHLSFYFKDLDDAIEKLEELKLEYPEVWQLYEDFKKNRKVKASTTTKKTIISKSTVKTETETVNITETTKITTTIALKEPEETAVGFDRLGLCEDIKLEALKLS